MFKKLAKKQGQIWKDLKISTYLENFMKIKVADQVAKNAKEEIVNGIIRKRNTSSNNNGIMNIFPVKGENRRTEIVQPLEVVVARVARKYRLFLLEKQAHNWILTLNSQVLL